MEPLAIGSYLIGVMLLALTFFPFSPMTLKFRMPSRLIETVEVILIRRL
jgi:hypothetical protein